jgi:hypothetical protein
MNMKIKVIKQNKKIEILKLIVLKKEWKIIFNTTSKTLYHEILFLLWFQHEKIGI